MVQNSHHIDLEDISGFPIERSADYSFWEVISHEELNEKILADLSEEKLKTFFGVVRNGGAFQLQGYYYRIKSP